VWKVLQTTPKRLPTWVGGTALSPYDISDERTVPLNAYTAQATYLTAINFVQKSKLPFLVGFAFVGVGTDGYNNSASRGATVDLNACYYLTVGDFPTSKIATIDFHFADLNSYRDLDWVNYYASEALIFKDKESTAYKVSDLKGLSITDRTIIRVRLSFDVFLPFLGFSPYIRQKKLRKLLVGSNPNTNTVSYYGQIYRFDKYLDFVKNSFFALNGNVYLCP
jgi:hypothetical protein